MPDEIDVQTNSDAINPVSGWTMSLTQWECQSPETITGLRGFHRAIVSRTRFRAAG